MQTTPSNCRRRLALVVILWVSAVVWVGCAHPARSKAPSGSPSAKQRGSSRDTLAGKEVSPEEERRAEAYARFSAGLIHDLRDEDDQALDEFEKAIRSDPSQDGLALDVARRHLLKKETDKAIAVLREAIAGGGSGVLSAFLASIYASVGRTQEAIDANLEAIKRLPNLFLGYQNLAMLYSKEGRFEDTLKVLERAGEVKQPSPEFLIDLAELWIGFGQAKPDQRPTVHKKAGELLDRLLAKADNPAVLLQRAADGYLAIGQNAKATELYLKLLEKYPQATPLRERLADLFLQSRDSKRAIEQMEALIKEEPSRYPQAYLILGSLALQENKFKEAEDYLRKAVVLTPTFEPAYYDLAIAQMNSGNNRAGLETLDDARHRFSETFQTEFLSGLVLARMKDYSNAVRRLTGAEIIARTRETNRLTAFFYFQLGSTHERNKGYEESEKHFRKALELQPDFAEALNYLGYMWVENGVKLEEALKLIEKAVKLEPKNGAFLDSLAWVLFKLGKPKDALAPMLKSIEHSPEPDPTLFDHLGDIQYALGEVEKAADAWRKSLQAEPNPEVQKKLDRLGTSPKK